MAPRPRGLRVTDDGFGFEYYEPQTLDEALSLLVREGEDGAALAGGTDLLLRMRRRIRTYRSVVNLKRIPALNEMVWSRDGLTLGALTTFRTIETDSSVGAKYPALRDAARVIAGVQLRNLATVGGNLGNASPAADSLPPLVALGATVTVASRDGSRAIPVEDCIAGPGRTVLNAGQLFTTIHIPEPRERSGNAFLRFGPRSAMDIGIVSVATSVTLDAQGRYEQCRVALGAVSPKPMRALASEEAVKGEMPRPELADRAGLLAAEAATPISDIRGSADYRRAIVRVLTMRTLQEATESAKRGGSSY